MLDFSGRILAIIITSVAALGVAAPARAEGEGPVIVIPSRPGVPVVINGLDASYAVVEGDWGLSRPGAVPVVVIGGSPILPNPIYAPRNSYHPRYGHAPYRGRLEIEPAADRELPEPAESFLRSWSTQSDTLPATIIDPQTFSNSADGIIGDQDRGRNGDQDHGRRSDQDHGRRSDQDRGRNGDRDRSRNGDQDHGRRSDHDRDHNGEQDRGRDGDRDRGRRSDSAPSHFGDQHRNPRNRGPHYRR
jgi:hypothetical protein